MARLWDFVRGLCTALAPGAAVVGAAALAAGPGGRSVGGAVWISAAAACIVAQAASDRRRAKRAETVARQLSEVAPLTPTGKAVVAAVVGPAGTPTPPAA